MNKIIVDILSKIEESGYEAYIVGGYVRDKVLGMDATDIDICTNAKVFEIMEILKEYQPVSGSYGAVKFMVNKYKFDITTYRKDVKYNGDRRNVEVIYVNNLVEDITRRDFTCNTLCMNKNGEIIDLLNAQEDINNQVVRCVGDIDKKLQEDPLRILRAIRFASCLDFKIETELFLALKKYRKLIDELSMTRIKEELTKILVNKNVIKGLDYLRRLGMLEYVGIEYDKIVPVADICGMFSQLTFTKEFPFSKEEKESINIIKKIVSYGKIDKGILFDYGLYLSMVAGNILGIDREDVIAIDKGLEIKSLKDIMISSDEICDILGIEPSKAIGDVYSVLKEMILDGEISNENEALKEHLTKQGKKWLSDEGEYKKGFTF